MEDEKVITTEEQATTGADKASDFIAQLNAAKEQITAEYEKILADERAEKKTYQDYITKNVMNGGSVTSSPDESFDKDAAIQKALHIKPGSSGIEMIDNFVKIARAMQKENPNVSPFALKGDTSLGATAQYNEIIDNLETLLQEANGNQKEFDLLLKSALERGTY